MLGEVLLLAVVQLPSAALRDTLRATQHAHETGQTQAVRMRWERAARTAPSATTPALALALLDRLRYDYSGAARRANAVLASPLADRAARVHARLLLAGIAGARWQLKEAESLYRAAREDAMRAQDAVSAGEATLRMAGTRARTLGAAAALATIDTAESLAAGDQPTLAAAACIRSQVISATGDTAALRHANEGLRLAREIGQPRTEGACLQAIAQHWVERRERGAISRALESFRAAESVQTRIGDHVGRAAARQWMGYLLRQLGQLSQSRQALEGALADAARSGNRSAGAWAGLNLALLQQTLGDDAASYQQLTAAGLNAVAIDDRRLQAQLLAMEADVSMNRGDLSRARAKLDSAVRLAGALGDTAFATLSLGARLRLARLSGNRDSTHILLDLADTAAARGISPGFLTGLARASVMLQEGRLDAATEALRTMPPLNSTQAGYVRRVRTAEIAARRGELAEAASQLHLAIDTLEIFRSRLRESDLRLQVQQLRSLDQVDPDLGVATVLAALATGGEAEAAFMLGSRLRSHELREVMLRRRALDTLQTELPKQAASQDHDPAAVRTALRPGEALVFLLSGRGGEPTTALVLAPDTLRTVQLPMADSLEPLVRRFTDLLVSRQPSDGLARRLGRELLAPIVAVLPAGTTRIIMAPDRPVLSLPFEALLLPDGRRALERLSITLVPSPAVFVALRRSASTERSARGVLALAQPERGSHRPWRTLPALPWAAREANSIVQALPASQAVIGRAVRVADVEKAGRESFAVLHVAAHAVVNEQVPARSAILLEPSLGAAGELRLGEVEAMRIPVQLVVLSACRTVRGREVQGEGLRSLGAAFLQAGARSVVGTAWDVEDASIAAAMQRFYAQLARGMDAGAALMQVKRELHRAGRPPAEWAVLQLLGDPRVAPFAAGAPSEIR